MASTGFDGDAKDPWKCLAGRKPTLCHQSQPKEVTGQMPPGNGDGLALWEPRPRASEKGLLKLRKWTQILLRNPAVPRLASPVSELESLTLNPRLLLLLMEGGGARR